MTNSVPRLMTVLAIGSIASLISMAPMNAFASGVWDFEADMTPADAIALNPDGWNDNECGEGIAQIWKFKDNNDNWVIKYEIMFMGDLEIVAEADFDFPPFLDDKSDCYITAMHIHNAALGPGNGNGPHLLNIYGLPGFDDADVVIDVDNKKISGIYTSADATCDLDIPNDCTGDDTKEITDEFVDDLKNGDWYVAVHSKGNNIPNTEIRGFFELAPTVGGEFLSINSTALLLAGLQSSAIWMLPVLAGAAGAGAFFVKSRTNKN